MTIEFGDWQLRLHDNLNWELYHRHATKRGSNKGVTKWHPCERFYSYSTIENAIRFAADDDLRRLYRGTFDASEFLTQYRSILTEFSEAVSESLRSLSSPEN